MVNSHTIIGNIGSIKKHAKVILISVATNKQWKKSNGEKEKRTTWHYVAIFGKLMEIFNQLNITKGDLIYIRGEVERQEYEGEERVRIVAEELKILKSSGPSSNNNVEETTSKEDENPVPEPSSNSENNQSPDANKSDGGGEYSDLPF